MGFDRSRGRRERPSSRAYIRMIPARLAGERSEALSFRPRRPQRYEPNERLALAERQSERFVAAASYPRAPRTRFSSTPIPVISTSQTSPCFIALVDPGVPVKIESPGVRRTCLLMKLTICSGL